MAPGLNGLGKLAVAMVVVLCLAASAAPARAQSLLRDAGMEHGLNFIARPILIAAGLPSRLTRVLVVNDMSLNAFVLDSHAIYINAGLLLRLQSAEQLQAVLAHETAHIANGHFSRRRLNAQSAQTMAGLSMLLGLAAGAASGNPDVGFGVMAGTAGVARRNFFAHTRAEEAAADRSAMRYLSAAGVDPKAMRGVLDLFAGQEALSVGRQDPYASSHPLTADRLRAVDQFAAAISPQTVDHSLTEYWFDRAKGKLSAYLRSPGYTLTRVSAGDTSDAAAISRAMAYFRKPDMAKARAEVAGLLERLPEDPYIHELSGWFELESGNVGRAVPAYARAAELAPMEPLILAGYGRALLAVNTPDGNAEALEALETARARDPFDPRLLRDLAVAYARAGNNGMASVATAERYALQGQLEDANIHAHRANGLLPAGSPGWRRAQDIMRAAEAAQKQRR
jgi:predicted Zn-dependent protease